MSFFKALSEYFGYTHKSTVEHTTTVKITVTDKTTNYCYGKGKHMNHTNDNMDNTDITQTQTLLSDAYHMASKINARTYNAHSNNTNNSAEIEKSTTVKGWDLIKSLAMHSNNSNLNENQLTHDFGVHDLGSVCVDGLPEDTSNHDSGLFPTDSVLQNSLSSMQSGG
jgi:hypothetical protein